MSCPNFDRDRTDVTVTTGPRTKHWRRTVRIADTQDVVVAKSFEGRGRYYDGLEGSTINRKPQRNGRLRGDAL